MKNILQDNLFANGFNLNHIDGLITRDFIKKYDFLGTSDKKPVWKIAQWCCHNNLGDGSETVMPDGSFVIEDVSKTVRVFKGRGVISLALRASREYGHARKEGEGWPHLLIEQEFKDNVNISTAPYINIKMDFLLSMCKCCMNKEEKTNIHTMQFQWIFAVADRNKKSEGYGDYVWLVLPLYDDRYEFTPLFMQEDCGKEECTNKFIYSPSNKLYLKEPVKINKDYSLETDIKKYAEYAVLEAKKRGFLKNSAYEDMYLHNTNIGFEITGTYDAEIEMKNINILVQDGIYD